MERMRGFTFGSELKYEQLLYLACYVREGSCKYKEFLYREGDEAQEIFLIEKGEFHYIAHQD